MLPTCPFDHRVITGQGKVLEVLDTPQRKVVLDPRRCGSLGETLIVCCSAAEFDQERALPVGRTFRFPAPI